MDLSHIGKFDIVIKREKKTIPGPMSSIHKNGELNLFSSYGNNKLHTRKS